jgi:hypothetical protein
MGLDPRPGGRHFACPSLLSEGMPVELGLLLVRGWSNLAPHKHMGRLEIFLALAGTALLVLLVVTLLWRKLYVRYPFFFAYIAFAVLAQTVGFSASRNYLIYFWIYWITEALYAILALLALHEVFHDVFKTDYEDWPWFWMIFPGAVLILTAFLVGDVVRHPPAQVVPVVAVVISFGKVVNIVKGGLFVLFFLLALLLTPWWQRYPYGIVLGFAVSAFGSAAVFHALSVFGTKLNLWGKYGPPVAYILGVLVWIRTCFQRPDPRFRPPPMGILEALGTVKEHNRLFRWITGRTYRGR